MTISLNRSKDADPLYIQVADIIRQKILGGDWQNNDALPPEKNLMCGV